MDAQSLHALADSVNFEYIKRAETLITTAAEEGYYNTTIQNPVKALGLPQGKELQASIVRGICDKFRSQGCSATFSTDCNNLVYSMYVSW